MKHLYKTVISLAIAVSLGLFYGNAIANPAVGADGGGVGNGDQSGDGLNLPHLELLLDDMAMGSEALNPEAVESNGTNQSDDALWDDESSRLQDGAYASEVGDGVGKNSAYGYKYQRAQFRNGAAVGENQNQNQNQTKTSFSAEVSTRLAKNEEGVIKLYQGDRVRIASKLMVDEGDVGQSAQCMVVAQYKNQVGGDDEPTAFMLSEEGWINWTGSLSDLTGVECQLQERQTITAHDDEIFPGEFNFYFGYQLENGKLIHSPGPLSFIVK